MNVSYFSVYDKKTTTYGQLFPASTAGSAERSFFESINNDANSLVGKYPDDFALYRVFEFDDESGQVIQNHYPPQLIVEAIDLKK